MDIYLQPSKSEGCSFAVAEAMLHGKPVVVTPRGGLPEQVEDGVTGLVARDCSPRGAGRSGQTCWSTTGSWRSDWATPARTAAEEMYSMDKWLSETTAAPLCGRGRTPPGTMIQGRDIVCLSSLDWDAHWTSKQQVMHRLAEANRVLYVDEPATMLAPFMVSSRWKRWKAVVPRLRQAEAELWTLTPPPLLPFGNKRPGINRVNQAILARYVRWAMKKLSFTDDHIFWTYLPATVAVLDRLYPAQRGQGTGAGALPLRRRALRLPRTLHVA